MIYYYACSYPLASASIVEKGNWGRICRLEPLSSPRLIMEMVFENIRLKDFPERSSRFDCNFVCPNIASLRHFVVSCGRPFDLLYEVEIVNSGAKMLETDWTLPSSTHPNIKVLEEVARRYWNPGIVEEKVREVLTESSIRITKRLP